MSIEMPENADTEFDEQTVKQVIQFYLSEFEYEDIEIFVEPQSEIESTVKNLTGPQNQNNKAEIYISESINGSDVDAYIVPFTDDYDARGLQKEMVNYLNGYVKNLGIRKHTFKSDTDMLDHTTFSEAKHNPFGGLLG